MNINYKQPQFELFPTNSATLEDVDKPKFFLANLTLSTESLVILVILGIMVALFSFSLGVERGKHLAAQALDERVSAAWNLAPRKAALSVPPLSAQEGKGQLVPAVHKQGNGGFIASKLAVTARVSASKMPISGRFAVQAAAYKNEVYAKQEALHLKAKGFQSFLIKKGDLWLICLGPFATRNSAAAALKKVQPKYPGSSVRRL
ncbi:MAG: SPOR domain-containing protein [Candidatus Omnitrophica bacterium]|nr:SPOR domain-containing protein [Candidatus Omnitrophota bacterium]